ncbi:MAG: hypothetical protein NTX04_00775 [Verrucomicrobia bacterium]|nr:hypothetical protein [Verrucomicrobiota bacterium]
MEAFCRAGWAGKSLEGGCGEIFSGECQVGNIHGEGRGVRGNDRFGDVGGI